MKANEYHFLNEMLYEAIFVPIGEKKLPKEIIKEPLLQNYIKNFGRIGDFCLIAEKENTLIGAIWIRLFTENEKGFGFVNEKTPELSMAIFEKFRGLGLGKLMLEKILLKITEFNFSHVSLSVDKRNFAYELYKKHQFIEVNSFGNTITMIKEIGIK